MEIRLRVSGFNAVAFLLMSVASVFFFLGFASPAWGELELNDAADDSSHSYIGLWQYCGCSDVDLGDFGEDYKLNSELIKLF